MEQPRVAVLAAAGRGRRVHPRRRAVPKVLLEVAGKSLLIRNLELARDDLGVLDFIVVVGHLGDQIREALGDGTAGGLAQLSCCDETRPRGSLCDGAIPHHQGSGVDPKHDGHRAFRPRGKRACSSRLRGVGFLARRRGHEHS